MIKQISWTRVALFAAFLAALPVTSRATFALTDDDKGKEEKESSDEKEEDSWFALIGGDVHTGSGGVLRGATVLSKNGVIEEIGFRVYVPEDAETLDVTGYRVYPGLVAVQASSSITKASTGFAADDEEPDIHASHVPEAGADALDNRDYWSQEEIDAADAAELGSDVADGYDPFGYRVVLTLSAGITTVGSSNAAIKLRRDTIDDIVMREKYLTTFSFTVRSPSSKRNLRVKFEKAAEYLRDYRQWQIDVKADKELDEPKSSGVDTKVLAVLRGESRAKFNANDRGDLLEIARLAQSYDFRPVIQGCAEGWTVAGELGRAGASAIVTPRTRRDKDERFVRAGGSSIENAAILHEHGVPVAVIPRNTSIDMGGITGRDLMHFPIEAAFAVRGGLSELAALEAMTIVPARLLGVGDRVGSIEVGKDADMIVTDGDILHYETFVQWAIVGGQIAYDKQDELFFRHIRPRPEPEVVPEEPAPAPEEQVVEEEDADDGDADEEDEGGDDDDGDDDDGDDDDGDDGDDDDGDDDDGEGGDDGEEGGDA